MVPIRPMQTHIVVVAALALAASACAGPAAPSGTAEQRSVGTESRPKRITATIQGTPTVISNSLIVEGNRGGLSELEELVKEGLTVLDFRGMRQPRLAEAAPTAENGRWVLLPDGRMETTWRVKPQARWHDGTRVTAEDAVFSAAVARDREIPLFGSFAFGLVESVEAPDPQTVVVRWRQPYVEADGLFAGSQLLPRHLLEATYREEKHNLQNLPYWNREFVGAGPFKVKRYEEDQVLLEAFDAYILGRPKIDEILVKVIPDANTIVANILAGEVEMTLGRNVNLGQALQARDQWRDGRMDIGYRFWVVIHPQFINPDPPVMLDVQFRRALLYAIDRGELADSVQFGLTQAADNPVHPSWPEYPAIQANIVRYPYDPRQAAELLEGLGYARGADGVLRDASGNALSVELRTNAGEDIHEKSTLVVADQWKRLGVAAEPLLVPQQRARDREYMANRPGFRLVRADNSARPLVLQRYHHGSNAPLPENRYAGSNDARYINLELDALLDRYSSAIRGEERIPLLGQILHHISDRVRLLPLYYNTEPTLIHNRIKNAGPAGADGNNQTWNAYDWQIG